MRTEQEIYELILHIAKSDTRVLAVYMNGSRTNKNAVKDIFQDYDIVYVVEETASFIEDKEWIKQFGEILYMQFPDENPFYQSDKKNHYGWLMQFMDGNRIDLTVQSLAYAQKNIHEDKLCKILLDKNHVLPAIDEATDVQYWVQKPTQEEFLACCNEFWWCSNNIAKGLWRNEIPYVQDMTNLVVRKQLEKMLSWKIGILEEFRVSVGKSAKYMYHWLSKEEYNRYLSTYFGSNVSEIWKSIFAMCDLFEETSSFVAKKLGYEYNTQEGQAARGFLEHVSQLPSDATKIYP